MNSIDTLLMNYDLYLFNRLFYYNIIKILSLFLLRKIIVYYKNFEFIFIEKNNSLL